MAPIKLPEGWSFRTPTEISSRKHRPSTCVGAVSVETNLSVMALTGGKTFTVEATRLTHSTTPRKPKGSAQRSSPRGFHRCELIRPLEALLHSGLKPRRFTGERPHPSNGAARSFHSHSDAGVRLSVSSGRLATSSGLQRAVAHVCCERADVIKCNAHLLVVVAGINFLPSPQPFETPTYPSPSSTSTPPDPPPQSKLRLRDRL